MVISMEQLIEKLYNSRNEKITKSADGLFRVGINAISIFKSNDGKVEFILLETGDILGGVISSVGTSTYYSLRDVSIGSNVTAVLMDLDGTTADSEKFWIDVIRKVVAEITGNPSFSFSQGDMPFVSGHSVSEHLDYCIKKFSTKSIKIREAMDIYNRITDESLLALSEGDRKSNLFNPNRGLDTLLTHFKEKKIKVALVTSGNLDKVKPEISTVFSKIKMGDPCEFYDAIVTAGSPIGKGKFGSIGEMCAKPHPWLYLEACQIGLGYLPSNKVFGIEDSGAGVCALRFAGIPVIGLRTGNIVDSGYSFLCDALVDSLSEIPKELQMRS